MLRQRLSKTSKKVCLLDSNKQCTPEKQKLCDDLNEIVDAEYRSKTPTRRKNEKKGEYRHYSPQQKAKIARYTIDNGATKAARHFSEKLGTKLNESIVHSFKSSYLLQQKQNKAEILTEVASKPHGWPKILNDELDKDVCDYIRSLREEGGVINSSIVQSVGRGSC